MAYSFVESKKALGLFSQANSFSLPDGAMEQANNIVINDDNVVLKMRGFYEYNDPATGTLNALFNYQDRVIAAFNNKASYYTDTGSNPNKTGTETTLSGVSVSITSPRVSRGLEQNGNLYFTTDNGVLKLDAYDASIFAAGASPGLDIRGSFTSDNGPIEAETQYAVRVVFGRKDANQNLILGAPSDILTLTNQKETNCAYTRSGGGPYTVTVTSANHNLSSGMSVTFSDGSDPDADGTYTITVIDANTFSYSVVGDPGASGTVSWKSTRQGIYWFSVPSDITNVNQSWFYQVYRTSQSGSALISPSADFRLIDQVNLTAAEITAGFVTYIDAVDDVLVEFAPQLYTNPNSREGEDQANYRPPKCADMALFLNYAFYADCETRQFLDLDVVDADSLTTATDYVETNVLNSGVPSASEGITNAAGDLQIDYDGHGLSNGDSIFISNIVGGSLTEGTYYVVNAATDNFEISTTSGGSSVLYSAVTSLTFIETTIRRYVAISGVGNRTVKSETVTNSGGDILVGYTGHGFSDGFKIYISTITGGTLTAGFYFVVSSGANSFKISLTSGGAPIAYSAVTSLYFEGSTNGTYPIFQLDKTSSTVSVQLRNTAQGLVKALNRDTSSLVFGNYTSGLASTPGEMRFTAKSFTGVIYVRANTTTAGDAFYPILPSSFASGTQVSSTNDVEVNAVYISKVGEPEAVPLVNKIFVGSRNKAIKRILALRNSVIVLKEDGVFKITGDNPINFTVTPLDTTVFVISANSAAALNNQIYFLAINGICVATDSAVEIVSRRIENRIETIVGLSDINEITAAVAYDSDRTYRISTTLPNEDTKTVTYFHNTLNDTWTESDQLFNGGVVGPNNIMYYISTDNRILKERKEGTRIDFSNQNYSITVSSVAANLLSAVISSPSHVPEEGDFIVKSDVITRIASVTTVGVGSYSLTFFIPTNLAASDSLMIYERIVSTWKMAPFHGGILERGKQFSQLQAHLRAPSVTKIEVTFSGQTFGGSDTTTWLASNVTGALGGWGFLPWGYFPWGLAEGIDNFYQTAPAPVIRLYVPLFQQRNTFIQATFNHAVGGEAIEIQALSWAVRAYQERVTK